MDPLIFTLGIISLAVLVVFAVLGVLSVKHAARFRYLSARTIYLTIGFAVTSTILVLVVLGSFLGLIFA